MITHSGYTRGRLWGTMALFRQVTIAGLGLIGGSMGMAIRRRRLAGRVVGLSRSASTIRRA
ncbi:MAG: hypothetical protein HYZ92_05410, partial [Candidatus Omnitrophica bacterium]|nr:hypothetical protein [Candidatus Omnitrophota bacterium]